MIDLPMERYDRLGKLIRLTLLFQARREGLSIDDIREEFRVPRRTAERMRDAVRRHFPLVEGRPTSGDRKKYWRIHSGSSPGLVQWEAQEIAALESAADLAESDRRQADALLLRSLATKVRSLMPDSTARRLDPDIEALTQAEGLATRPGPVVRIDPAAIRAIRAAILAKKKLQLTHRLRSTQDIRRDVVEPIGLLYGRRHYFVAFSEWADDIRLYSLPDIQKVEVTDQPCEREGLPDLNEYASRSFGVFQEDPVDVAWRFTPEAAPDAREFVFHPNQKIEEQADGGVIVRFHAGGLFEMAWHLFTWGDTVEILEPVELRDLLVEHLEASLRHHQVDLRRVPSSSA